MEQVLKSHGVEDQAERGDLVHSLAVVLAQFAALPEEDPAGEALAGFGDVELGTDHPAVSPDTRSRADQAGAP